MWRRKKSTMEYKFPKTKKKMQNNRKRSKKNYNPAACGTKTTFTER